MCANGTAIHVPRLDERFWNKVDQTVGGCWEWVGRRSASGYGQFDLNGRTLQAHRVMAAHLGRTIAGLVVRHTCDNPGCVNPAHLLTGTQQDNVSDRVARGREGDRRGVKHGKARLNTAQVLAIRADTRRTVDIARAYGVQPGAIYKIRTRRTWRHV